MNIFIYGLINPLKNRFFYIGQTNNLARRFSEHLVDTSDSVKACEMQQLRDLNLVPSIVILEVANEQTANAIEQKWNEPEHYNRIQHEFYTTINIEQFLFAFKRHYGYLSFNEFRDKYYSLKAIYDVIPENMLPNLNLLYNQT